MAWLLRKLLLNDHRSLVSLITQSRPSVPRFVIHEIGELSTRMGGWIPLEPIEGKPTKALTLEEVLKYPAMGMSWSGDDGRLIPVSDLIAYLANVAGAVQ
jgi:hypothetical protein